LAAARSAVTITATEGRDLPRPGPRPWRAVPQSRRHFPRTDGDHHRPEQEPRPGGMAPWRDPAARRRAPAWAAGAVPPDHPRWV